MIHLQCASFWVHFHNRNMQAQPYNGSSRKYFFLQYNYSLTMINIVKKYLRKKIHELKTPLSDLLLILSHNTEQIYCRITNGGCFRFFTKLLVSQKLTRYPHIFFHLKSFLWEGPLTVKVR